MKFNEDYFKNKKFPLGSYLSIIHRQYAIYLKNVAEKLDINAGQVPLLVYLLVKKDACQNDIADSYKIDKASIARSIRKLEDKGLVKRKIDDSNRKKYKLSLTEKGRQIALEIKKADENWEQLILEKIEIDNDSFINALQDMAISSIELNFKEGEKE